ncbi:MAG: AMP-binding protein [Bacteroidaceae bacterium]|nr:AMP-binding protein [Bacteroidaceae bacterium]
MNKSFNLLLENSIKDNWNLDALTDYKGATLQFKDVARKIEKMHIMFEAVKIKPGDKIALCGRNSAHWGVAFLATITYGAVVVPILHEFKADNIHSIVNHCDARFLFVGDRVWENLDESMMPHLEGIILLTDFSVLVSRSEKLTYARENLNAMFGQRYPKNFRPEHVHYHQDKEEELAVLSYTSGTTSQSKGVMLPYRSLWSNVRFAMDSIDLRAGHKLVSMLPLAHCFGLAFEFLFEFCVGCHVYFLTRVPSPKIIFQAFAEISPNLVITVPLVVEKIIKKEVMPKLESLGAKFMLSLPYISDKVYAAIRKKVVDAFGGNFISIVIGGAALNKEVEKFLQRINLAYTVGYGMTECGPLIAYVPYERFKEGTCGKIISRMEIKIDSPNPAYEAGEILLKGDNVFLGYYKNKEATKAAFTDDGWMRTGDLGTMDFEGNITIRGRSKNMILSANGQNIYPEEIEAQLNDLPYVAESIVVQRDGKLVALVYPDFDLANMEGISDAAINTKMEQNRIELNTHIPSYCQVAKIIVYHEEFEKTPKKSIKRYLYQ